MLNLQRKLNTLLAALLLATVGDGCGSGSQPPPKLGVRNCKPRGIGGPVEVRPLPPADQVVDDWQKWLESEGAAKARVYEITLSGASNQLSFKLEIERANTPLGWAEHTDVSFLYRDPTNGTYEFIWSRLGRHSADFLKLGDRPKAVWVSVSRAANRKGIPLLDIEGFEGLEPGAGIIAEPGRRH